MFCLNRLDLACISESWACRELDQSLPFFLEIVCWDCWLILGGWWGCPLFCSSSAVPAFPFILLGPIRSSSLSLHPPFCPPMDILNILCDSDTTRGGQSLSLLHWQLRAGTGGTLDWTRGWLCTSSQVTFPRNSVIWVWLFDFGLSEGGGMSMAK